MRCRQISNEAELLEIIKRCQWCHMAMVDPGGNPYLLPMNFGYRDGVIYLHGADQGKKISVLEHNPSVCINFSTDQLLRFQSEDVACSYTMKYRSVLVYGKAEFITEAEEKIAALNIIMSQYSDKAFKFNLPSVREVKVWKIKADKIEGRALGY
ncbi:MAG: pyridoxamine 5'-phosphate oxidase family protein [Bacteroidetes bacterium]|nr:MAG: pyridoxamine 5'-phosphate oxidase family protein [Bacteroidota bacterium]